MITPPSAAAAAHANSVTTHKNIRNSTIQNSKHDAKCGILSCRRIPSAVLNASFGKAKGYL